ncbi:hypothetical protein AOC36_07320 [Erysipelothrix larvae]|uniref:Preprotein translocase subunit YajC n=1 Tax=Erysipelothrix larvae TaxID=1514105 RepID=A0A109UH93_9FIRM|nr:preprotein translocase subunit YajC [Erysipelothrix larvae]AMC93798.1 hypothetical protein AOC36_07320 [Erysipelothrix larvae]
MTPFHVVLYTSLTVIAFIIIFLCFYWFRTKSLLKKSNERSVSLKKELKPGMKILCAGGVIGIYQGTNKDGSIAKVKLANNLEIEVAFYSIANIIV